MFNLLKNQIDIAERKKIECQNEIRIQNEIQKYCQFLSKWMIDNLTDVEKLTIYLFTSNEYGGDIHIRYDSSNFECHTNSTTLNRLLKHFENRKEMTKDLLKDEENIWENLGISHHHERACQLLKRAKSLEDAIEIHKLY